MQDQPAASERGERPSASRKMACWDMQVHRYVGRRSPTTGATTSARYLTGDGVVNRERVVGGHNAVPLDGRILQALSIRNRSTVYLKRQ